MGCISVLLWQGVKTHRAIFLEVFSLTVPIGSPLFSLLVTGTWAVLLDLALLPDTPSSSLHISQHTLEQSLDTGLNLVLSSLSSQDYCLLARPSQLPPRVHLLWQLW